MTSDPRPDDRRCAECGAPEDGTACRAMWDELLALEFSDLRAGGVHLLTVASYQLQHAATFALYDAATQRLLDAIAAVVHRGVPIDQVRSAMNRSLDGPEQVRSRDAVTPRPSRDWSTTVAAAWPPDPATHAAAVTGWARAVLADLGR